MTKFLHSFTLPDLTVTGLYFGCEACGTRSWRAPDGGEADTPEHILLHCPALVRPRLRHLGNIHPREGGSPEQRAAWWRPWGPPPDTSRAGRLRSCGCVGKQQQQQQESVALEHAALPSPIPVVTPSPRSAPIVQTFIVDTARLRPVAARGRPCVANPMSDRLPAGSSRPLTAPLPSSPVMQRPAGAVAHSSSTQHA